MKQATTILILAVSVTIVLSLAMFFGPLVDAIYLTDAKFYDYYTKESIQSTHDDVIEDIVIINIDNKSISNDKLGKFQRWPLEYHAKLVDIVDADTPKVIAFDMIFDKERDEEQNKIFVDAVKRSGRVLNAISFLQHDDKQYIQVDDIPASDENYDYKKDSYVMNYGFRPRAKDFEVMDAPFTDLLNASKANGSVAYLSESDAVVRRAEPFTRYLNRFYPFLGLQAYLIGNDIETIALSSAEDSLKLYNSSGNLATGIPIDDKGLINITYHGMLEKFRVISYYQVLEKQLEAGFFKDKYVFIGTNVAGLFDLRATPLSNSYAGVGIHTNLLTTVLESSYISRLKKHETILCVFLVALLTITIVHRFKLVAAIISIFVLLLFSFLFFQQIFETDRFYVQQFPLILSAVISLIVMYAYKYNTEEKSKRMIRSAFSQFVNKSVVDDLLADPSKLKLGGEKKDCSVFFSDVAGFTTISEQLEPEKLVHLLNAYLTDMTNIIFENDGMIDKYIGDAIMAVYGAPVSTGNHAVQSCRSALQQQERLASLRQELMAEGYPELIARMGINTGPMVVGNMGSQDYFNYTVMGDSVNLAARLEPANKDYDTLIMIGSNTYEMAKDEIYVRQLDLMVVKGKTEPIRVYELMGMKDKPFPEDKIKLIELFNTGYQMYLNRQWQDAINTFEKALNLFPDDGPSKLYVERCLAYAENEPADEWIGVYIKTSK
jgi:adenylate cyclase